MSLRFKTIAALLVIFAMYVGLAYAVERRVVYPSFERLEQELAIADVQRCIDALDREVYHLDLLARDWSAWDDTWEFVQELRPNSSSRTSSPARTKARGWTSF